MPIKVPVKVPPAKGRYAANAPEVIYVFESILPSAFKNCAEVPPDLIIDDAVTLLENVAAPVEAKVKGKTPSVSLYTPN